MGLEVAFDGLVCAGLLGLAWRAVTVRDSFRSIVLFMVFGLLMAVTWGRLGAPDLALAEAAIGAGVTGALLLNAYRAVLADPAPAFAQTRAASPPRMPVLLPLCLAAGLALAMLMLAVLVPPERTAVAAMEAAERHALGNPVTAVLLDFRAYDTLMEMVVLLLAFLGLRILFTGRKLPDLNPGHPVEAPMLTPLLSVATPVLLLMGLYLYQTGSHSPGGAFQAGALLGALGVLHRLAGRLVSVAETGPALRLLVVLGLGVFALVAGFALAWGPAPLSYPDRPEGLGYALILAIELALMLSIAATLVLLFAGAPGLRRVRPG